MIKIKLFADWCSIDVLYHTIITTWDIPDGIYKNIQFVLGDDFTHAVVFNCAMPNLAIPKQNVVGFSQEPRPFMCKPFMNFTESFLPWAIQHVGTYFIDDNKGLPSNFIKGHLFISPPQWSGVCWKTQWNVQDKPNMMSVIGSEKRILEGHKLRHALIQRILKTDLNIHIYGRQMNQYSDPQGMDRVRGPFLKSIPHESYKYVVAIENFQNDYYYSEKFCWCLEKNCIPIYYGARKIKEWYGDCCIELPSDPDAAMNLLRDILENDPYDFNYNAKDKLYEELYFPQFLINHFKATSKY